MRTVFVFTSLDPEYCFRFHKISGTYRDSESYTAVASMSSLLCLTDFHTLSDLSLLVFPSTANFPAVHKKTE